MKSFEAIRKTTAYNEGVILYQKHDSHCDAMRLDTHDNTHECLVIALSSLFIGLFIAVLTILAPPGWLSGERVGLMTWWL